MEMISLYVIMRWSASMCNMYHLGLTVIELQLTPVNSD